MNRLSLPVSFRWFSVDAPVATLLTQVLDTAANYSSRTCFVQAIRRRTAKPASNGPLRRSLAIPCDDTIQNAAGCTLLSVSSVPV